MATDFGFLPAKDGKFYFISYNTEDSARVAEIVRYMHERGVPFWYDYGLEYGKEWETQIASHIAECEAVLMFVTKGLFLKEKSYVRKEYDEAMIFGKRIIPVFLDDIHASSLPKHSVGFYVDLNRLHNVRCAKGDSAQKIAERAAFALGVKLAEPAAEEMQAKPVPIVKSTVKKEPKPSSGRSIKKPLVALICAIVVLAAGIGLWSAADKSGNEPPKKPASASTTTTTTTAKKTTTTTTTTAKKTTTTAATVVSRVVVYDGLEYRIIDDKAVVTNYTDGASKLVIPSDIDGVKVTAIGANAFNGCSNLTSVVISDGVISIGQNAFRDCDRLKSIAIPNSVTSIEGYAFLGCQSLADITIPNSVISIGNHAFWDCNSLRSITIPDSVKFLSGDAFWGCTNLAQIKVSGNNKYFSSRDGVLYNKNFTILISYPGGKKGGFTIPEGVTTIGDSAFNGSSRLTQVIIPDSVTSIESYAFHYCDSLKSIDIPNGVKSIGESTFDSCSNLTSITIPDSITFIGDYAFSSCDRLKSITIPSGVRSIKSDTFLCCDITVYAPHKADYYGSSSYEGVKQWIVR